MIDKNIKKALKNIYIVKTVISPLFHSELVMENTQGSSFCEGSELYTDVEEPDKNNEKKLYMEQESDNPLYEVTGTNDAVFNPIYNRFVFFEVSCCCCW